MKLLITIALAITLLTACKNKPETATQEHPLNNTPADHEDFNTFFAKFKTDSNFQILRIKFPLMLWGYLYLPGDEIPEGYIDTPVVLDSMTRAEYSFFDFEDEPDRQYDKYEFSRSYYGDSAEITLQGIENGLNVAYHFKLINRNWYLVKVIDSST